MALQERKYPGSLGALSFAHWADSRKRLFCPDGQVIAFALEAAGAPVVKGGAGSRSRCFDNSHRGKRRRGQDRRRRRPKSPGGFHRQRVEIVERGRTRSATGMPDDLRRPTAPTGSDSLSGRQGHPVAADPRCAEGDQGRCSRYDRNAAGMVGSRARGLCRQDRGDSGAKYPEFETIKLDRRAYSPADLESLNINLVGGDPYGGSRTIDQFFTFRPFADSRNSDTHVKDLYQIGASVHTGPGLGRGSGYNLAKKLGA